jgi:hypothetical protein
MKKSGRTTVFLAGLLMIVSLGTGFAMQEKQPHLQACKQALETAKLQLTKSELGHTSRSLQLVNQALAEVQAELNAKQKS